MTKTTVCMPVSHSVVPYSDLQATPKQVNLIRMLLNLCGLFHSYSLPSVALGSSAAQHTSISAQPQTFCQHRSHSKLNFLFLLPQSIRLFD